MKNIFIMGVLSCGFIALMGCTNHDTTTTTMTDSESLKREIVRLEKEKQSLGQQKGQEVKALEAQIAALRNKNSEMTSSQVNGVSSDNSILPPNPKAGECYARVLIPAKYSDTTERVQTKSESYRIETSAPEYKMVDKQVLLTEASYKLVVVPGSYKTITEKVLISEASSKLIEVPAVYETVSERILVRPAYTTWKKGTGLIQSVDNTTGEIMCLVEVPDEYKTVTRRVVKTPATTREVNIPAQYKVITSKVIDQPASTKRIEIPAKYKTIKVRTLTKSAEQRKIEIPAEYRDVSKRKLVQDSYLEWRTILCETNTTPGVVARIQKSLLAKGHNPGQIDGVIGQDTMRAVNQFQLANKLPRGQLTIETLNALDVSL